MSTHSRRFVLFLGAVAGCAQTADLAKTSPVASTETLALVPPAPVVLDPDLPSPNEVPASSPNKIFVFKHRPIDNWATRASSGALYRANSEQPIWQKQLPNDLRPRFAFVSDAGEVVTFDDWDNYPSPLAVVIYDMNGRIRFRMSFDQICNQLGVDAATLTSHTRHTPCGPWLQAKPEWSGKRIALRTAGRTLQLDLTTGKLIIMKQPQR